MIKRHSYSLQYYIVLIVAYAILTILVPFSHETRHTYSLSLSEAHLISLIMLLPLFVIWLAAFYCYEQLQKYAWAIRGSTEGRAFKNIADGVALLSWGLVVQAFVSLLVDLVSDHSIALRPAAVIIQSYITLIFPVIALPLIAVGTRKLARTSKGQLSPFNQNLLMIVFAVLGSFYSFLILHLNRADTTRYFLPQLLELATVTVPYLYAWYSGLNAAFLMNTHAQATGGIIYRRGLHMLSSGLTIFIVASILMQYLNSAFLSNIGSYSLVMVLIIDHTLLLGIALGYIVMIGGVRRLQKLEDI